jgi:hypothetical protein
VHRAEAGVAEDGIADSELTRTRTERFDRTREFTTENWLARSAQARDETADNADEKAALAIGITGRTVGSGDCGGVNPDQYFVSFRLRPRDVSNAQHLRRSVPIIDDRFHLPGIYLTR